MLTPKQIVLPFNPRKQGLSGKLAPDHENDRRGCVPLPWECVEIEKAHGLSEGTVLLMNGERYLYAEVGTFGEEEGEKPCLWGWKLTDAGLADERTLLNVWRVE